MTLRRTMTAFCLAICVSAVATQAAHAQTIGIATNPEGSIFHRVGVSVAKLLDEKMGLRARVQPFAGTSVVAPVVNSNEVQLGIINENDVEEGFRGTGNFKGRSTPDLRYLVKIYTVPFGFLVARDTDIRTIADLKGRRVGLQYTAQRVFHVATEALLANAGLAASDVVAVPIPSSARGVQMLSQNQVDAVIAGPGAGFITQANAEMRDRGGVRFLSVDTSDAAWQRTHKHMNIRPALLQPADHLPGIIGPTTVVGYYVTLVSNNKLSDDLAYRIVKMMHENRPFLVGAMPAMAGFNPAAMTFATPVPYHPGAIKFYKEAGQWPPKD